MIYFWKNISSFYAKSVKMKMKNIQRTRTNWDMKTSWFNWLLIRLKIRLKNIDEKRNYFDEEIEGNESMNKKHKKVCKTLNCINHFLILASAVAVCVSTFTSNSFVSIPIGTTSSAIGLKICAMTAEVKKYKSILEKERRRNMIK